MIYVANMPPLCAADERWRRKGMSIRKLSFGSAKDGREASLYRISAENGSSVSVTDFGAHLVSVKVPDSDGGMADVVLGFDTVAGYQQYGGYLGGTIGRFGNRIAGGRFTLNDKTYQLALNDGENTLHGGDEGFDQKWWDAEIVSDNAVKFSYVSPDGEENYPGTLRVSVAYSFDGRDLQISYTAQSDKDTIVNLTNHAYFNLAGKGTVLEQSLQVASDFVTDATPALIPTGELLAVEGTPLDLNWSSKIGSAIDKRDDCRLIDGANGFDVNYVLKGEGLRVSAVLKDTASGRSMTVLTTEPAIQVYSGQGLDAVGHNGMRYSAYSGLALETQHYPDSPNHPNFPSTVLKANDIYTSTTIYRFTAQ